jgi:hypothetical protein
MMKWALLTPNLKVVSALIVRSMEKKLGIGYFDAPNLFIRKQTHDDAVQEKQWPNTAITL